MTLSSLFKRFRLFGEEYDVLRLRSSLLFNLPLILFISLDMAAEKGLVFPITTKDF